mmetsp:Transcript_22793/g.63295  ORF Transcript_22793/g.63295 Transcript_22793/m.63295 type:complete len:426 (+) Transcript_22793:432-1709(+)
MALEWNGFEGTPHAHILEALPVMEGKEASVSRAEEQVALPMGVHKDGIRLFLSKGHEVLALDPELGEGGVNVVEDVLASQAEEPDVLSVVFHMLHGKEGPQAGRELHGLVPGVFNQREESQLLLNFVRRPDWRFIIFRDRPGALLPLCWCGGVRVGGVPLVLPVGVPKMRPKVFWRQVVRLHQIHLEVHLKGERPKLACLGSVGCSQAYARARVVYLFLVPLAGFRPHNFPLQPIEHPIVWQGPVAKLWKRQRNASPLNCAAGVAELLLGHVDQLPAVGFLPGSHSAPLEGNAHRAAVGVVQHHFRCAADAWLHHNKAVHSKFLFHLLHLVVQTVGGVTGSSAASGDASGNTPRSLGGANPREARGPAVARRHPALCKDAGDPWATGEGVRAATDGSRPHTPWRGAGRGHHHVSCGVSPTPLSRN